MCTREFNLTFIKKEKNDTSFFGSDYLKSIEAPVAIGLKCQIKFNFSLSIYCNIASADPKSTKNAVKLSVFFVLSGSTHVKVACKTLMKLTR